MHFINFAYSHIYRTSILPLSSPPFPFPSLRTLTIFLPFPPLFLPLFPHIPFPFLPFHSLSFHSLPSHSLQFILYQPTIYLLLSAACSCLIFHFYLIPSFLYYTYIRYYPPLFPLIPLSTYLLISLTDSKHCRIS